MSDERAQHHQRRRDILEPDEEVELVAQARCQSSMPSGERQRAARSSLAPAASNRFRQRALEQIAGLLAASGAAQRRCLPAWAARASAAGGSAPCGSSSTSFASASVEFMVVSQPSRPEHSVASPHEAGSRRPAAARRGSGRDRSRGERAPGLFVGDDVAAHLLGIGLGFTLAQEGGRTRRRRLAHRMRSCRTA